MAPLALVLVTLLSGCRTYHESMKDSPVDVFSPPLAPLAPAPKPSNLSTDDIASQKAALAHAMKNGQAAWNNKATGNHGLVKTGKAMKIGASWCTDVTSTTYADGQGVTVFSQICNPPLPAPGKA